jgi:hypothetical protein
MVKKIRNIIVGWFNHFFKPMPNWAKERLNICNTCPHAELILNEKICSKCGCVCKVKVLVEDEICYDGRWNDIKINEYDE